MRKDIFESEEEFVDIMGRCIVCSEKCFDDAVINFKESLKEAKKLGLIKQSPFEKLSDAWENFRPQKYYHEDWNGLYVSYNDQWVTAATDVIDAQEKVIEYLKQKLEEQS